MSYKHFTPKKRNELAVLLRVPKLKKKNITEILRVDRSSLFRELKRNKEKNKIGYDVRTANKKASERRRKANQRFKKIENNKKLREYIIKKIKENWSPEQISGRIKKRDDIINIGKDSIYKFIYEKRPDLVKHLRCQKGKYRRKYGTRIIEKQREKSKKRRIDQREEIVEKKERIGDWEGDTIVGKEKNIHILTHVDRKSGYLMADKLERATATITKDRTIKRFKKLPKKKRHTITYDNGSTFADHEITERETKTTIYFAYPYHSWERGCNENANGLLRQYFKKGSSFKNITQKEIDRIVRLINNRPRKRLNYKTPFEVFHNVAL